MANEKENLHKGHRKRMLQRYIDKGIDSFHEHEVIEMLLYLAYPNGDVNPLAHKLLDKYGSLNNLLNASVEELSIEYDENKKKKKNSDELLTQRAAAIISMIRNFDRYAKSHAAENNFVLSDVYDVGRYCCKYFGSAAVEVLTMIILDSSSKVKTTVKISEGNVRNTVVVLEKILMYAIKYKANGVILCHNHPGGNLDISNADKEVTRRVGASLKTIGISLIDHIVCCDDYFESMEQRGMIIY